MHTVATSANGYQELRKRIIRETELALLAGLIDPQPFQRIPFMEVGRGRFEPSYATWFWAAALGLDPAQVQTQRGPYSTTSRGSDRRKTYETPYRRCRIQDRSSRV